MTAAKVLRMARWPALSLLVLWLGGCASPQMDWDARVGNYNYDQAIVELGPPDKQATLQDGTVVAEWLLYRGRAFVSPAFGYGYGYPHGYGPFYPAYTESWSPDRYLRLVFGPDKRLTSWKRFAK